MYLVSVIIPIYNVGSYLRKCLSTILSQTYTELEIILVDDGSLDYCGQFSDEFALIKDSRIKVIHKPNGGLADARNIGFALASGKYIAYVDSDDWVESDYIECLLRCCLENDAQMSVCRYENRFDESEYLHTEEQYTCVWTGTDAVRHRVLDDSKHCVSTSAWNKFYKKELITNIVFPKGRYYEDIVYTTQAMLNSNLVVYTNRVLYHYRKVRDGSIMNQGFNPRIITDELPLMSERNRLIREVGLDDIADLVDRNYCIRAVEIYRELYNDKNIANKKWLQESCVEAINDVYNRCSKQYFSTVDRLKVFLIKNRFFFAPAILNCLRYRGTHL